MTIERLMKVVSPPERPGDPFLGPWAPVEAELGTPLPQDYKDFVRLYGYGYFMEFLGIDVPRCRNPHMRLERNVRRFSEAVREVGEVPSSVWPQRDGLLPFGGTDNGDTLLWLRRGAPARWQVVIWDDDLIEVEVFDCDLTDFLAGLATGTIQPTLFPDDFLPCDRLFTAGSTPPPPIVEATWRMGSFGGREGRSKMSKRDDS
jgi:hypothetical protein